MKIQIDTILQTRKLNYLVRKIPEQIWESSPFQIKALLIPMKQAILFPNLFIRPRQI
jgi:hypothetical protein